MRTEYKIGIGAIVMILLVIFVFSINDESSIINNITALSEYVNSSLNFTISSNINDTDINVLKVNASQLCVNSSCISDWDAVNSSSGGGTPAGSTGEIQYNTAAAFDANSNLTFEDGVLYVKDKKIETYTFKSMNTTFVINVTFHDFALGQKNMLQLEEDVVPSPISNSIDETWQYVVTATTGREKGDEMIIQTAANNYFGLGYDAITTSSNDLQYLVAGDRLNITIRKAFDIPFEYIGSASTSSGVTNTQPQSQILTSSTFSPNIIPAANYDTGLDYLILFTTGTNAGRILRLLNITEGSYYDTLNIAKNPGFFKYTNGDDFSIYNYGNTSTINTYNLNVDGSANFRNELYAPYIKSINSRGEIFTLSNYEQISTSYSSPFLVTGTWNYNGYKYGTSTAMIMDSSFNHTSPLYMTRSYIRGNMYNGSIYNAIMFYADSQLYQGTKRYPGFKDYTGFYQTFDTASYYIKTFYNNSYGFRITKNIDSINASHRFPIAIESNKAGIFFGQSRNAEIKSDGTNLILNSTTGNVVVVNVTGYGTIAAHNFLTLSKLPDVDKIDYTHYFDSASSWVDSKGVAEKENHPAYSVLKVEDTSNCSNIPSTLLYCYNVTEEGITLPQCFDREQATDSKFIGTEQTYTEVCGTKYIEGLSMEDRIVGLEGYSYQENTDKEQRIQELESTVSILKTELCKKDLSYSFCK